MVVVRTETRTVVIRESETPDLPRIEALYDSSFPDEHLVPLVRTLLDGRSDVCSLVATDGAAIVGHAVTTKCSAGEREARVALLGPLAVAPDVQRQGIGSALVRECLQRLAREQVAAALVLGDPGYYGRFGFAAEADITPPYQLPDEWRGAWQSIHLRAADAPPVAGALHVPAPWRPESLWLPQ